MKRMPRRAKVKPERPLRTCSRCSTQTRYVTKAGCPLCDACRVEAATRYMPTPEQIASEEALIRQERLEEFRKGTPTVNPPPWLPKINSLKQFGQ